MQVMALPSRQHLSEVQAIANWQDAIISVGATGGNGLMLELATWRRIKYRTSRGVCIGGLPAQIGLVEFDELEVGIAVSQYSVESGMTYFLRELVGTNA